MANTVLRLMPKYSIAMHGNAWHCSIAEDASGKDLCFHVVTVLYKSTTSGQARCTTEGEQPIIHNRLRVVLALSIYLLLQHVHHFQYVRQQVDHLALGNPKVEEQCQLCSVEASGREPASPCWMHRNRRWKRYGTIQDYRSDGCSFSACWFGSANSGRKNS